MIGVHFEDFLRATAKTYASFGLLLWTPNLSPELPTLPHLNLLSTTKSLSDTFKACHSCAQNQTVLPVSLKIKSKVPL